MIAIGVVLVPFGASYGELREAAQVLDGLDYDSLWMWDHYVSWDDPRESTLECWTTLAGLAEATTRIRLGSLVANNTNHHPARLAKIVATLAQIADGRVELGIGAGGWAAEQAAFGIAQGDREERQGKLAEALHIISALWSGEPVTFHGQYYQLTDAIVSPGLDPRPRIIVGGRSTALARLAARHANGLNLQWGYRDQFPPIIAALEEELAAQGRDRNAFELSLHADWRDLKSGVAGALAQWEAAGFTRVMLAATAPFPRDAFEHVAREIRR